MISDGVEFSRGIAEPFIMFVDDNPVFRHQDASIEMSGHQGIEKTIRDGGIMFQLRPRQRRLRGRTCDCIELSSFRRLSLTTGYDQQGYGQH